MARTHTLTALSTLTFLGSLTGCGSPATQGDDAGPGAEVDAGFVEAVDGYVLPTPPVLVSGEVRAVGRFGEDVRFIVRTSDVDGDAATLRTAFLDASGEPVLLYDYDADGELESNVLESPFLIPIVGPAEADGLVILRGFLADHADVARVELTVLDSTGLASSSTTVDVTPQTVAALGEPCDPTFVEIRCEDGLGCPSAVPAVCVEGQTPTLTRTAFYGDLGTAAVLVEGADADDDVASITIQFRDATGASVTLDLDGDGTAESSEFEADARGASSGGTFFYRFDVSDAFVEDVAQVAVFARDRGDHTSEMSTTSVVDAPTRRSGQSCDPLGFDRCTSSVCTPGTVGVDNTCTAYGTARTMECSAATSVDLFASTSVTGVASGPSLWDAPAGCSANDPTGRPEGVVHLHLGDTAPHLRLSTDNAYTTFDTTVYVISACDATPALVWCLDDTAGIERSWLSRLELTDVPAGDYYVIVDSFSAAGGRFQLDITSY